MEEKKTLESPPEVQFAGVARWLRENLFSSISSSILTLISIAAISRLFRSGIGFFISPEREWTAVTYNMQLYMVQAYPEADFIRVWITVGLLIFLLGISWGFNSINEKIRVKDWCDGLLKVLVLLFFLFQLPQGLLRLRLKKHWWMWKFSQTTLDSYGLRLQLL
jgi:hypothetical protein